MNVLFLNRAKENGRFSFEELFKTIKSNLNNKIVIKDYYHNKKLSLFKNIKLIKNINSDIIHITGGVGFYSLFLPTKKTILTIHDTNHYETDLKGIKKWIFGLIYYKLPIKNVKYVTVVSNQTKNKLIQLFNTPKNKVIVIPNCYPNKFTEHPKAIINEPIKILQIGTKQNKNLNRLITALENLNVELTIIGKIPSSLTNKLSDLNINYNNKFNLSHSEIYQEYIDTDIVSFISLKEGFGLPIIEANRVGRAVITSNCSSMPEVAGDAACLVDPLNVESIRLGFEKLINDNIYRRELIEKGYKNALRFSPKNIADLYSSVYQKAINE